MLIKKSGGAKAPLLVTQAAEYFGVEDEADIFRDNRRPPAKLARWALMYTLHRNWGWGQWRLSRYFNKDRDTIRYGLLQSEKLMRSSPAFHEAVGHLEGFLFDDHHQHGGGR